MDVKLQISSNKSYGSLISTVKLRQVFHELLLTHMEFKWIPVADRLKVRIPDTHIQQSLTNNVEIIYVYILLFLFQVTVFEGSIIVV